MSKRTFYIDFYQGSDTRGTLYATTLPGKKMEGSKRIAFDVIIPDELIHEVDGHAAEVSRPRMVEI